MEILRNLYLKPRLLAVLSLNVLTFALATFFPALLPLGKLALLTIIAALGFDIALLYGVRNGVFARRNTPERFSNGDDNTITIVLENTYRFAAALEIIDEVPAQLQMRSLSFQATLAPQRTTTLTYRIRPVERGEYIFGAVNVFVQSPIGFAARRYRFDAEISIPVYPSYLQMRKYELLAISNRLTEAGVKKIRRIGHTMEFEHIREYVIGDDYRTINWKATARSSELMVNQYQDEQSQQVYAILDMGRVMKMPFAGMTLLDHAINAALVISNIALMKHDRAGLVTFSERIGALVQAQRKPAHIYTILEALYNLKTDFMESDYRALYAIVKRKIHQRSLLLLFTNFETLSACRRQLPFLRRVAANHVLVVIFFDNTELRSLLESAPQTTEDVYIKTIAEKFAFEKREIVKELQASGIHAILTAPERLSVDTINKYLELKARGVI